MKRFSQNDSSVVVVIGSGAGGGTLANALAQKGIDVICLEAGKRLGFEDMVNNEAKMFGKFTWLDERIGTGIMPPDFPVWNCKTVGGTTMHWTASCPRLQEHEFKARSTYGHVDGTTLVDWPLSLEDLAPYYRQAEDRLGVTGTHGIPRLPGNNNYKVLAAGAKKIGYKNIDTNNLATNSGARNGRPGCIQLGFCTSGCKIGAKWSSAYTDIPAAEASEHFELRTESIVTGIQHNKDGKVTEVEYLNAAGELNRQKARVVCVAGNTTETTRLLLNSASSQYPDGLGNSSKMVGKNYMRHVIAAVVGEMPGTVNMHRGAHQAGIVKDEQGYDPSRGFFGGFLLLTVPFTPDVIARFLKMGAWGEEIASVLENYDHLAAMLLHGEDPPQEKNRITLHPTRKDRYGLPVPIIHYEHHPNSLKLLRYAVEKGKDIYRALGAKRVFEMIDVFPATHNMGTARMGTDAKTSVCNRWGQTHDIANLFISDGSLFPSAGCENPTLTIVALALRQADYLEQQLKNNMI